VYDRKLGYFKGLERVLLPCARIYEIDLMMIDNCEMSVLFPAVSNRTQDGAGKPSFNGIIKGHLR
jgi:hypothetical protein